MRRRRFLIGSLPLVTLAGCLSFAGQESNEIHGESGDIELLIDGEEFDLTQDRFQAEHAEDYAIEFHFHEFDDQWYMEGDDPVTVGTGLDLIPHMSFEDDNGTYRLTIVDTTYDAGEAGTAIDIGVNEESVDPMEYVLADGDSIRIEVETS